jgi:hypothetical protein
MKRLSSFPATVALGVVLWGTPVAYALLQSHAFLETPRLNLQRAPIQTSFFLAPAQTYDYVFEATQENLFALHLFMRPEPIRGALDQYTLQITSQATGETRDFSSFSALTLWDDVATVTFIPFENGAGDLFEVRLTTAATNRTSVQLATWLEDSSVPIHQPYYLTSTSFLEKATIGLGRVSWRWIPYLLVLPALCGALKKMKELLQGK